MIAEDSVRFAHSGRKMEAQLKRKMNFIWLSGMQRPDFKTISLFRKNRLADKTP